MSHLSLISSKKDGGKVVTFPNSPFRLHQPFPPPSGDQPEAIDKLVEGIGDGLSFQTLLGVTGSGKTYTMANVIARLRTSRYRVRAEQDAGCTAVQRVPVSFSRKMPWNISSAIMITTSRRLMFRNAICSSRRIRRSTSISSRCACHVPSRS